MASFVTAEKHGYMFQSFKKCRTVVSGPKVTCYKYWYLIILYCYQYISNNSKLNYYRLVTAEQPQV